MPYNSPIFIIWHYLKINVVFIELIENIQIMVNGVTST